MQKHQKPIVILMADDSDDDRLMTRDALNEAPVVYELREVEDGEELMEYLLRRGKYEAPGAAPRPGLILLDLNMPRLSGREALREIKSNPALRHIPIVVLTTSQDETDIMNTYDLGVNSFITKPVTFAALVEIMRGFGKYWVEIVTIPPVKDGD